MLAEELQFEIPVAPVPTIALGLRNVEVAALVVAVAANAT